MRQQKRTSLPQKTFGRRASADHWRRYRSVKTLYAYDGLGSHRRGSVLHLGQGDPRGMREGRNQAFVSKTVHPQAGSGHKQKDSSDKKKTTKKTKEQELDIYPFSCSFCFSSSEIIECTDHSKRTCRIRQTDA